jgi:excisionase family DNA binding protein
MKLTIKQAAARAGVSPALVYQWCEERRLPHYRLGGKGKRGKILVEESDLDAFLASLKVEAGQGGGGLPGLRHINLP